MNASLERLVGRMRHASESIATGSTQIATGNADLSQRTEEQASNLQQTAASMAARAGEQGRGFAVVAGEVRNLAQRSAEAAKEIKALIGSSVEKVEAGSRLVDEAGRSMGDIVSSAPSSCAKAKP